MFKPDDEAYFEPPLSDQSQSAGNSRRLLDLLSYVGQIVSSGKSIETVLYGTVNLIKTMLDVERCSILIIDPDEHVLRLKAASNIPTEEWEKIRVPLGQGISGSVARDGKPLLIEDINKSEFRGRTNDDRYSTSSFISVPLIVKGHTIGVINVNNRTDAARFCRDDLDLMTALAGFIALSIENGRLFSSSENLRAHLENIVESLHLAVLTMNLDREVSHLNSRLVRLLALNPEIAAEGRSVDEVLPDVLLAAVNALLPETIRYGTDARTELDFDSPLYGRTPLEVHLSALPDATGKVDGVLVTFIDVSMRREVDELRRLDEMKSNFMSMVSHELRTPLTAIKGAVHLLSHTMGEGLTGQQLGLVNMVSNNSDRLTRLVNDLLDLVHIENQTLSIVKRPQDLSEVVQGCIDSFSLTAQAKSINVQVDLEHVLVSADRERLSQAIGQLIDNAIKFTPKKGDVSISTGVVGEYGIISVRDSGCGIPPEVRPRLFSKFFQAQNPMTRTVGGTGIGLYMAKSIVELHGGRIDIAECKRGGSRFVIKIPLLKVTEDQTIR